MTVEETIARIDVLERRLNEFRLSLVTLRQDLVESLDPESGLW